MQEFIFNPYDPEKRMNWNLHSPDRPIPDLKEKTKVKFLMLDRKTGRVYMKESVTIQEVAQMCGHDALMAYAFEEECFS